MPKLLLKPAAYLPTRFGFFSEAIVLVLPEGNVHHGELPANIDNHDVNDMVIK